MKKIENSHYTTIIFSSGKSTIKFDKLSAAYLYNTLIFLGRKKHIIVSNPLYQMFHNQVSHSNGAEFKEININYISSGKIQQCYCFTEDKSVDQTVQILVNFIFQNNLMLENAKEFLITTIGEIFSNAFTHSNENKIFFMFDIELHDNNFYLVINITDYGNTIIYNVQQYQKKFSTEIMYGCSCIKWAMEAGNTTRSGSGGYGLPTLKNYVENIKGELLIFSGDSLYALKGTKENIFHSKGEFYGTSISMKIPLFDTSKAILYDKKNNKIISIDLDKI